ncbi:MAG: hypothetical protein WD801_03535 [Gemmatimonadaceae bacterium]
MLARQKQLIEALWRTRAFLRDRRPAEATPAWDALVRDFSAHLDSACAWATQQIVGHRRQRAATAKIRHAERALRVQHLRPIVAIAHAFRDDIPGIVKGLQLPRRRLPITQLIAESNAIRGIAASHRALMVSMGRPADFAERLDAAVRHLATCVRERNDATSTHAGATAALAHSLRRARTLIPVFDSQLIVYYEKDGGTLAEWGAMKRVHARPGPVTGALRTGDTTEAPAEQHTAADPQVIPFSVPRAA